MNVITGATGHVGAALVRELSERGEKVRILVRPGKNTGYLAPFIHETSEGDVRDLPSLVRAFKGARRVYHLAAVISITSSRDWRGLAEVNVEGTRNVCAACRENGVERLIYTSSVHALPEAPSGEAVRETKQFGHAFVHGAYAKSKAEAARVALEEYAKGLPMVMAHPTGILGPFEPQLTHMGQLMADILTSRLPAWLDGAYDFVDVRDVARGLWLMAEKGRLGENYLLSGHQLSVDRILSLVEASSGKRRPRVKMPHWVARMAAPFFEQGARLLGRKPLFTGYSIYTLGTNSLMDHGKASAELGYAPRPAEETVRDQLDWIRGHLLPGSPKA